MVNVPKPTRVYCASIKNRTVIKNGDISHTTRAAEISAARNSKVREQKLFAWKLLEYAVKDFSEKPFDNEKIVKTPSGKWVFSDNSLHFSISHTDGMCAVAVGNETCGVDIEKYSDDRFSEALAKKILNQKELLMCERLSGIERQEFLFEAWTKKESIFKMTAQTVFVAKNIFCADHITTTQKITVGEETFFLSLCANDAENADIVVL